MIRVQTDSDWAGKDDKRKSVSGGSVRIGGQWVKSWSKDQGKIARSSGEAELYAANLGAAQALGIQTNMKELGWPMELVLEMDANATIGILHRRGLGKLRHVEVEELWLQQEVNRGKVIVKKVPGKDNTADIGTKAVNKEAARKYLKSLELEDGGGKREVEYEDNDKEGERPKEKEGSKWNEEIGKKKKRPKEQTAISWQQSKNPYSGNWRNSSKTPWWSSNYNKPLKSMDVGHGSWETWA